MASGSIVHRAEKGEGWLLHCTFLSIEDEVVLIGIGHEAAQVCVVVGFIPAMDAKVFGDTNGTLTVLQDVVNLVLKDDL